MKRKDGKNRTFIDSFADALRGIGVCVKNERNMRIHTVAAAYVLVFAPFLGVTRGEYAVLIAIIAVVISAEIFNTAVEAICDYMCKARNRYIRNVKDIAAGAVLISAIAAFCIGVVILWRPAEIWMLIQNIAGSPLYAVLFAASVILSLVYVMSAGRNKTYLDK